MLARARCIRSAFAEGVVEVYSAGSEAVCDAPGVWKAVSTISAGDQERWHNVLDFCAHQALQCMVNELSKAWRQGLQRLDVLRPGMEEYERVYMQPWDVADMAEEERLQVRPSIAAAIQGILKSQPAGQQSALLP